MHDAPSLVHFGDVCSRKLKVYMDTRLLELCDKYSARIV